MKTAKIFVLVSVLFLPLAAFGAGQIVYQGNCASAASSARVRAHAGMQRALRQLSQAAGRPVKVYSCIRSYQKQLHLYNKYGRNGQRAADPRYGQHVQGTAADFSPLWGNRHEQCRQMDKVRSSAMGGAGGVGTYRGGSGHLDARSGRCNWNICKQVLGACGGAYRSSTARQYMAERSNPNSASGRARTASRSLAQMGGAIQNAAQKEGSAHYRTLLPMPSYKPHKNRR